MRALRAAGLDGLEPWAVDLAERQALLACDVPDTVGLHHLRLDPREDAVARVAAVPRAVIGFRPLTRADLPDVVRWVHEPHVARWWNDEAADLDRAEAHYGPAIDGTEPTRRWVVEINGRSVGFVQDYLIGDHPDWALLTAAPDAVGFDYAIGERSWVGHGLGTRMLWQFLRDVVRPHYPQAPSFFAAPDHRNVASLRVLDKLGFVRGLWFDEPRTDGGADTVVGCRLDVRRVFGAASAGLVTAE
ncbi:GNAT family N-acetyltransferase [Nocardioides mesophilus]|uniref:Lysine N-acyltransferase MbtK n=1 Tax=Nocardioides mesophilus TaxID=433659 RepID=A0A7G9RHQ6_9ACTN|nr:GNAT family N-acetyltransferase [Nocardioides mesophilus]